MLDSANETGKSVLKRQATWDALRHSMLSLLSFAAHYTEALSWAQVVTEELFPLRRSKDIAGWVESLRKTGLPE